MAVITATSFSLLIFGYNFFREGDSNITYLVSISLFAVILFASLFGTVIPLLLHKFKIDPALATGPFITTMNDISGLFIYFTVARYVFGVI